MFKKVNWLGDFGLLVIRLMLGVVFIFHGSQKLFGLFDGPGLPGFAKNLDSLGLPYPAFGAVLASSAEFLGGLALITGFGMRTMTIPLITAMGVACWYAHNHSFSIQQQGMEYPLTLGVVLFGMLCAGPGRFALSRLFPKRETHQVTTEEKARRRVLSRSKKIDKKAEPSMPEKDSRVPSYRENPLPSRSPAPAPIRRAPAPGPTADAGIRVHTAETIGVGRTA